MSAPAPLPASVKVLSAHQSVPDSRDEKVPKGIGFQVVNAWSLIKWADNPRTYEMKSSPKFVSVDISVDGVYVYRIQNVAVKDIHIAKLFGDAVNGIGIWRWRMAFKCRPRTDSS